VTMEDVNAGSITTNEVKDFIWQMRMEKTKA
jgi:hypothetical protein